MKKAKQAWLNALSSPGWTFHTFEALNAEGYKLYLVQNVSTDFEARQLWKVRSGWGEAREHAGLNLRLVTHQKKGAGLISSWRKEGKEKLHITAAERKCMRQPK